MNIKVKYSKGHTQLYTRPVYQYETDVFLSVEGLALSLPLVIDLSNNQDRGNAVRYTAEQIPVKIPKEYFESGDYVYAWLHASENTILIVIPVMLRPVPVEAPEGSGKIEYEYDEETENLTFLTDIGPILKNNTEVENNV